MVFIYLLLGHLIGDFVLQTNRIAKYKQESASWVLTHVVLVTASILLFSFPFGAILIIGVLVNGFLHFIIDFYKSRLEKKLPFGPGGYFFLDQVIHISILYLISLTAVQDPKIQALEPRLTGILLAIVFTTSYAGVQNQFILSSLFSKVRKKFFEYREKSIGNVLRLLNLIILYFALTFSLWLLLGLIISFIVLRQQFEKDWKDWTVKGYFGVKYLLDLIAVGVALAITFLIR